MLLDPGMDLTLRPMRYPHFYDRFRDAIKNTWTVEEVDLHSDLKDLARLSPAEQHLVSRLVAFFATGDTIVANNLVLNLYQHVNSPEGRLYLSRQLFEEAVHVQFYLTLLDTYVPDETERARGVRRGREHPVDPAQGRLLLPLDRLDLRARQLETGRRPPSVPAQPDLLRRLHRGPVLLRRLRLRVLPALARAAERTGLGHQLGVPRRVDAHGVRLRRGRHRPRRGAGPVRRRADRPGPARCWPRRSSARSQFAEDLLEQGVSGHVAGGHAGVPAARRRPAAGQLGLRPAVRLARTRSPSWSCRTSRSCRTSSSAGCRPTRSGSAGTVGFDDDF